MRNNNTVSFVFHYKKVMVHAVLIEISVTLRVLSRSKQVYAVHFRFRHNGSAINDNPVDSQPSCREPAGEIVFRVEAFGVPNLYKLYAVKRRDTSFDRRPLILNVDVALKILRTL